MKVLWFSLSPSLYKNEKTYYNGCGWIESLEQLIRKNIEVELAVSFLHYRDNIKLKEDKVTYYPIRRKRGTVISRIISKIAYKPEPENYYNEILEVINDFKPDVIHIWGTESIFSQIQPYTKIPIVIHLQGLINGCNFAFYPPGFSEVQFLFSISYLKDTILKRSPIFIQKRFKKKAQEELIYFKNAKYIMGRTNWDKSISEILAPQAAYFHVDEILRSPFYNDKKRVSEQQDKVIILSTLSDITYKGIDVILKTAKLLKQYTTLIFEWHIIGINSDSKLFHFFERHLKISHEDSNIIIEGEKSSFELVELMAGASIFVHPSYIDNSPNSVCEAQMLGLPIIASNVGGVSTLIENNVNGLLVPSNDPFALVSAIRMLAADDNLSLRLGQQARLTAMKRHDHEKIVTDILNVYKSMIKT